MLRENGTTRLNVVPNPSAPQADPFLRAVQDAAAADFDVLGEIGRGPDGMIIYLAREAASRRLVALRLQREGQLADEFSLEVVRHLDNSMPAPESKCVSCGKAVKGWARFCSYCGADLSGAAAKEGDAVDRALLLEAVKEAVSAEYEVLGEMSRNEGGGAVYFARDLATEKVVALRLERDGEEFSLGLTTAMKPLARSLGVKPVATQVFDAMPKAGDAAPSRMEPPPRTAEPARQAEPPRHPEPPSRPAVPPPPLPAAAGMSPRTKAVLGAAAVIVVAVAVLLFTLPQDDRAAPLEPVATDTAAVAAAKHPGRDSAVTPPASAPAPAISKLVPVTPVPVSKPVPAKPKDATIRITGLPAEAVIQVDGKPQAARTLALTPGRHVFSVTVAGYLPRVDTLQLRAAQSIAWSPALVSVPKVVTRPADSTPKPAAPSSVACSQNVQAEKWIEAFDACMREALAGSAAAKRNVGSLYERGKGIGRSDELAHKWYGEAAGAGDADAMFRLGQQFERGRGVKRDQATALQWYVKSGSAGFLPAQMLVAEAYEKGRYDLAKDKAKALEWYAKAAAQGSKDAANKLRDLAKP